MSSIELRPFCHEAQVVVAGDLLLHMRIDFAVIDRLEGLLGKGVDAALEKLSMSTPMAVKFLWAMTRHEHPDISLDQIAGIVYSKEDGPKVMALLGRLVRDAFNFGEPEEGEQSRPPRKRSPGASKSSSANGARQGSRRPTSGMKRRTHS